MSRMNILVVCQYYYPEPFRVTDICESLVKRGHEVTVLTGLPNYPEGVVLKEYCDGNRREELLNGVKVIRCYEVGRGSSKLKLLLNYLSYATSATFKALLMKQKFDVVVVNQLSPVMMAIPAMAYKMKSKKKMLLYCLDLWPASLAAGGLRESAIIFKLFYKISRWIYSYADSILVTSSMFKGYFRDVLKIKETRIVHLPQYAEDLFAVTSPKANEGENKSYHFVFAGNIGDMQSVETIILAANELKSFEYVFFHIIGEGSRLEACKKLAEDLQVDGVSFYGRKPIEEMPYFYDMADAMLVTLKDNETMSYTLPGKVQSYMAAGKPIIGAINGETRLVIRKANCGFTCKAEDYRALAQLVMNFCRSDEIEQMGKNAQKFYLDNYSKDRFMVALEEAILDLEV